MPAVTASQPLESQHYRSNCFPSINMFVHATLEIFLYYVIKFLIVKFNSLYCIMHLSFCLKRNAFSSHALEEGVSKR